MGGLSRIPIQPQPMYGIIWCPPKPWPPVQPMYGIPVDEPLVINNWETKEGTK
ncbi:MAG: hypothetical protein F6K22_29440 [Okeania sp. SIO2F4]|uniref:hypothetical protein n=1 Tax=Okeania sp. SIO2F4 TaxID=2607790 RepID=UPI00142CADF1|nr:hypothetical protein [Okeania sp. SIO2F4]NES06579.1 hypothetical protein [Okeania sp. SIO2F4]